ncbi:MAG TPA: GNAT family N-acetyltransferase, partial [Candidatus Limnocylindrales bacterium]
MTRRTTPAIKVVPATPERWPDVMTVMGGSGGDRGCWCQYYRWPSSEFSALGAGGGRRALERQVADGPPPGLLAYIEGLPVGWVGIGPRHEMGRLVHSRTIPLIDDVPVWSILCFLVRPGYRRRGVTKALIAGLIGFARAAGAPALEAYPIDAEGHRLDVT